MFIRVILQTDFIDILTAYRYSSIAVFRFRFFLVPVLVISSLLSHLDLSLLSLPLHVCFLI